jgi:catechol 2,3-dioxygenase-like lactoylglutathione lyase family enzyme
MQGKWIFRVLVLGALLGNVLGCGMRVVVDDQEETPSAEIRAERKFTPGADVIGTVAQYARILDGTHMRVKGYGVVMGLGNNGSREVPAQLREYLVQQLLRQGVGLYSRGTGEVSPNEVLNSLDTAVVTVTGSVPPLLPEGSFFDVEVTASDATGTKSLDGGILITTDLRLDMGVDMDPSYGSDIKAIAAGPVVLNPFLDQDDPNTAILNREGRIIAGGRVEKSRDVSLHMISSNYAVADKIAKRINSRFTGRDIDRVAVAKSADLIELTVPEAYRGDPERFIELVLHLPLNDSPGVWETHMLGIIDEMGKEDAPCDSLALVLEAQGGQVLPMIKALYIADDDSIAFYTARTGMRLGDRSADAPMVEFASKEGPFQVQAINTLGEHPKVGMADRALRKLVDSDNTRVRLAAYRALRDRGSTAVHQIEIGGLFHLDIVAVSEGNDLIYATRVDDSRIVLFGDDIKLKKPIYYESPNGLLFINGLEGDDDVSVRRSLPLSGRLSDKFEGPYDVEWLVRTLGSTPRTSINGDVDGLGLTYGQIVQALYWLCEDNHVDAEFLLQSLPEQEKLLEMTEVRGIRVVDPETGEELDISSP